MISKSVWNPGSEARLRAMVLGLMATLVLGACDQATMTRVTDALNAVAGAAPATNLIVNGSFEEPVVPKGSYATFRTGQSFPGWQVTGASGSVSPISGDYAQAGLRWNAQSGAQWLDMTGPSASSGTGVQQSVSTQPGATYTLVFYVGNVVAGGFGNSSSIEVMVDGKSLGTVRNDSSMAGQQSWQRFQMPVTAATATTTIAFINRDPRNDNSNGLDNVSLTSAAAAVRNIAGQYGYLGQGVATITQTGDRIHMYATWPPSGQGPHYEIKARIAGDTITGEWYSLYAKKGWFKYMATVLPNGDIEQSQSEDPINSNIRKAVLTRKH